MRPLGRAAAEGFSPTPPRATGSDQSSTDVGVCIQVSTHIRERGVHRVCTPL